MTASPSGKKQKVLVLGGIALFVLGLFIFFAPWLGLAKHRFNFLPYFASRGYPSHALSLSGHGASAGAGELHQFRIANYVQDLAETVERLGQDTVLIGHSMGGFVVQKFLEEETVPAAVLMAAVPPHGLLGSAFGLA